MREVETQLVGTNGRARLAHVVAEYVLQRLVQQMRRGVVRHRREADRPRHARANAIARGETGPLEQQRLVVLEAVGLAQLRARAVLLLDPTEVGDLAAARGIEGRLAQLGEQEHVRPLYERADLRQHHGLQVADELAAEACARRELACALRIAAWDAGA